ncbi:uncharacterized protein LOC116951962 [Petromyzon marinus]|uniref:Uncharacterized protein LOC116951962 isoform X1 n=1 Tax=Petromyzon marinus TaxID=7757 RepID=A0AAJ7U184_PETMA|nr:uncharacterized protein LOC116951962 isoform X1 [Petromyzon marinus]XP_032826785.1 uncharacterized protein LOC116951962 isoform X1 [Petromyzon marinus]
MACPLVADPRGDFPTWLATQGMKLKFAEAMERELGISDYEELLACAEDTQVMAELFGAAREKLPFAFYAVLRRILKAVSSGKRGKARLAQSVMEVAVHPFMNSLLEAIVGTLNSLSHELLQSADRFSCLEPTMYTGEQAEADEALRSTNNSSCVVEEAPVEDSAFLAEEDPAETWEQGVEHAWVERHSPASAGPWSEPVESQLDVPPDFHEAEKEQRSHGSWGRLQVKTEIIPEDFVNATRGGAGEPPPAPPSPGAGARDAVDADELDTVLGDVKNEMYRGLPKARVGSDHSAGLEAEVAAEEEEEEVVPVSRAWKAFAPPDTPSERYYAVVHNASRAPCQSFEGALIADASNGGLSSRSRHYFPHRLIPHEDQHHQQQQHHHQQQQHQQQQQHHQQQQHNQQQQQQQQQQPQRRRRQQHNQQQQADARSPALLKSFDSATGTYRLSYDAAGAAMDAACGGQMQRAAAVVDGGIGGTTACRDAAGSGVAGEPSLVCTLCGKGFGRARNLRLHMRTHTGERPYRCEFCGRSFAHPFAYSQHKRIHTGEKPYSCDVCGKAFARRFTLSCHRNTHGERHRLPPQQPPPPTHQ